MSEAISEAAHRALAAHAAGEISAEIALMRLVLALGDGEAVTACLERAGERRLLDLARAHAAGIAETAALVKAGLAGERSGSLAAIRAQFERAASLSPEAAVALYSLGSSDILDRATAEIVDRLRQWRLLGPAVRALDIGCGIGRLERALAPYLGAIVGIDLSRAMIAEARRRCAGLGNVEFFVGSGADLGDISGGRFGLVLAVDVFPYLVAADPAIAARHVADCARLLDPGGALVILNYAYRDDPARDRAEVAELAARHGFAVERSGTRDFALWDGTTFLLRRSYR